MTRSLLLSVILLACSQAVRGQDLSIDALLSVPHVTEIVGSPDGAMVAWVENQGGARNVWIAGAPLFAARRVTSYTADDGQEITSLQWTADSRSLVFVRGGEANRQGESANPALVAQGTEQAIWIVTTDGGVSRRLASGNLPSVSARGLVAYVSRGQVWAVSPSDGMPRRLFAGRGQPRELRWSPDGRRLAFSSRRDDHAFIAVYDLDTAAVAFPDPGLGTDITPTWAPDSRRLAFIRLTTVPGLALFRQHRSGTPWSIRVLDVSNGQANERSVAAPGPGSVFTRIGSSYEGPSGSPQLFWTRDERLVFPWERDGWIHLYSAPIVDGPAQLLTPGPFEVQHATLALDGRTVLYSSNQEDLDRRHIWSVPAQGGVPRRLTAGTGLEVLPVALRDGAVAFLRADARSPARPTMRTAAGRLAPLGAGAALEPALERRLVEPQAVTFRATDGTELRAQLFLPPDIEAGQRRPAVVYFHGGPWNQMLLGWHWLSPYHFTYALNQHLSSRGFIVLSVNFRTGTGYGLEFREPPDHGAGGASEVADIVAAGTYLKARADVDPRRIGIWGNSYGGYMTAQGLSRAPELFAAGVNINGPMDWNASIRMFAPAYVPSPDVARRNFDSSPLARVDDWRAPVLLVHGDDDRNVAFSQTVALAHELTRRGVPHESLILPDEVHGFLRHHSWKRIFERASEFLERHLGTEALSR